MSQQLKVSALAVLFGLSLSAGAWATVNVEAAQELMKQNKCSQCHGKDKDKDAPALTKISAKYKGKADAEKKLLQHLTTSPKVKLSDGTEEEHKVIKTTPAKDEAQIKNVIQYILSL